MDWYWTKGGWRYQTHGCLCRWAINSYITIFMATELMFVQIRILSDVCPLYVICLSYSVVFAYTRVRALHYVLACQDCVLVYLGTCDVVWLIVTSFMASLWHNKTPSQDTGWCERFFWNKCTSFWCIGLILFFTYLDRLVRCSLIAGFFVK